MLMREGTRLEIKRCRDELMLVRKTAGGKLFFRRPGRALTYTTSATIRVTQFGALC